MIILDEYKVKITNLKKDIEELGKDLGIESLRARLSEIEKISSENGFWDDIENSQKILSEQKQIKTKTDKYEKLLSDADDALAMVELAIEEGDDSFDDDIVSLTSKIEKGISEQKIETLLDGEYDKNNAILTFHAGAGGTEAQDWALMLFRMYTRFGEKHNFKVKVMDILCLLYTSTLRRIEIEDAVAADSIFTILMGEDVDPRRQYIEENAKYAVNLDY